MTNEAIDKILQTEKDAQAYIAAARETAAQKLSLANQQAEEILLAAERDAERNAAAAEKTAADHAEGVMTRGAESARTDAKKAVAAADPKMEAAVNEILREIFEKWQ